MCVGKRSKGAKTQLPVVTWEQVKQHARHDDCWTVIHGHVYNVTDWSAIHPGGDMILLSGGRDSTILFESYHVNGVPMSILDKYVVGRIESSAEALADGSSGSYYENLDGDAFYVTLKQRIAAHFRAHGEPRRDHWHIYVKTLLIFALFFSSWYAAAIKGSVVGAVFLGLACSLIGTCVMHDANHGAFSKNKTVNLLMGMGMDLIGSSRFVWELHHVTGHHQYTNLSTHTTTKDGSVPAEQNDPDIFSSYPLIRMSEDVAWKPMHKWQHIFALPVFGLFTMGKVFRGDFDVVMANTFGGMTKNWLISMNCRLSDWKNVAQFWGWKAVSLVFMNGVVVYNFGWSHGAVIVLTMHIVCGFVLALMFAVTHISENCSFLFHDEDIVLNAKQIQNVADARARWDIAPSDAKQFAPRSWAALQCCTSTNWALDSFFWTHFSGGLNHQIEHHLFPGITHTQYPFIQPIVEKTCAEYGVPYVASDGLVSSLAALLARLYRMGREPTPTVRAA